MVRHTICLLLVTTLGARVAVAQELIGVVRDVVTDAAVPGAVVAVLAADGKTVSRTLSSASGSFRIQRDGASALRVIRIGYLPYERPLDPNGEERLFVAMTPLGTRIRLVAVTSNPICPKRSDQREALATWTAATDALAAMVIASTNQPQTGTVTQILFDRLLDGDGQRTVRQSSKRVTTANVSPIRADRDAGEFARGGYVERRDSSVVYYAPDPEVLLAPSFAATHCLSIRRDRRRPTEIGVAFAPVRGRDSIPDISGVLWLSRVPLALLVLDFEYRGVDPAISDSHAGGTIEFESLSNGVPIIRYWHIRSPRLNYLPTGLVRRGRVHVVGEIAAPGELHESGGLIASGTLADGTVWSTPLAALDGIVVNSGTAEAVPGARVSLDSTDRQVRTDAAGHFAFSELLPGPYTVRVLDSVAIPQFRVDAGGKLQADTMLQQVVKRIAAVTVVLEQDRTGDAQLRLPWRAPVEGCLGVRENEPHFVVLGDVMTSDSAALGSATLTFSWSEPHESRVQAIIEAHSDERGGFVLCGIPASLPIQARVLTTSGTEYLGTLTVPRTAADDAGRVSTSMMRRITLVVAAVPSGSPQ